MGFKIIDNQQKIIQAYNRFAETNVVDTSILDDNYLRLRDYMLSRHEQYKDISSTYDYDLRLAIDLYEYLNQQSDFLLMYEGNSNFWKYVAVYVIPDIVYYRFDLKEEHYYKKGVRIYPYTLYWYIKLSYRLDAHTTYETLKNLNTDIILQLVERPTKIGLNVDLYRYLVYKYSLLPYDVRKSSSDRPSLFRTIIMKNTAKLAVMRPELYPTGINGYVDMLFDNISF